MDPLSTHNPAGGSTEQYALLRKFFLKDDAVEMRYLISIQWY